VQLPDADRHDRASVTVAGRPVVTSWSLKYVNAPAAYRATAQAYSSVQAHTLDRVVKARHLLAPYQGIRLGPVMDMTLLRRSGTVSADQFALCRDWYEEGVRHASNVISVIQTWKAAERSGKSDAEFLLEIRLRGGMSQATAAKTQITCPPRSTESQDAVDSFHSRLDHFLAITALAPDLAESLRSTLLDVDSKYDSQMPSPSDITLLSRFPSSEGRLVLYVVDATTSQVELAREKMESLVRESLVRFSGLDVLVMPVILRLQTASWRAGHAMLSPSLGLDVSTVSENDRAMHALSVALIESSPEAKNLLRAALHKQIDPAIDSILDKILDKSAAPRQVEVEVVEVVKALTADLAVSGRSFLTEALKAVESHSKTLYGLLGKLESTSLALGKPAAVDFFQSWRSGISYSMDRNDIKRAPPIPLAMGHKESSQASSLTKYDLVFSVVHRALYSGESEAPMFDLGAAVMLDGSTRLIVHSDHVEFSRSQSRDTHFANGVVAYVLRPQIRRRSSMLVVGGVATVLLASEKADYKAHPDKIPAGGKVLEADTVEKAPHVQILVNPVYYDDPSFLRFVHRRDTQKTKARAPERKEISVEDAVKVCDRYERLIEDLVLERDEAEYHSKLSSTFAGKVDFIFSTRAAPQFSHAFGNVRPMTENRYADLVDAEASICRAITSTLHSKLQANTVTLLNSSTHAMVALAFINAPAEHFRSCLVKTLSLSSIRQTAEFDHADMIFMEKGALIRTPLVGVTESSGLPLPNLHISGSNWDTWDRNHIEWMLERHAKVAVRSTSLVYSRPSLSSGRDGWKGWDSVSDSDGPEYMKREVLVNSSGFFSNRQQVTIAMGAQRYLHQSLGGLETDYLATVKKLAGIRLRTLGETLPTLKMLGTYILGVTLKLASPKEVLRSSNLETFSVMPHLLRASSDPAINTSAYFAYLQFNVEKQWRTPYEALDVLAIWKQIDAYQSAMDTSPEMVLGFTDASMSLIRDVAMDPDRAAGSATDIVRALAENISRGMVDITTIIQSIGTTRLEKEKTMSFQGCNWFELMVCMDLRAEVGTLGKVEEFLGKDLMDFFSMRGAIDETEFTPLGTVRSYRKASAMVNLLARLVDVGDKTCWPEKLAQAIEADPSIYVDLYSLLLGRGCGRIDPEPLIQLSDKNQPGKGREISTLKVDYGLVCILTELLSKRLSALIPEDMITSSAKIKEVDKVVKDSYSKKHFAEGVELIFLNQDKSSFGPNKRAGSMLMMAGALSPDTLTFSVFFDAIVTSRRKTSRYPHGLIKEALRPAVQRDVKTGVPSATPTTLPDWTPFDESTTTGKVMAEVSRQYHGLGKYGAAGSSWVTIPEGMPGQGIMGVSSSIAHSAVLRYMKKVVARKMGWSMEMRVTSDDSMCAISLRSESKALFVRSARRVVAFFAALASLIENEGKFVLTAHKPEMNTIYYQGPEVIPAYWKFMNACTALHTSGNMSEDLLHCLSKGNDAVKEGASFFDGALVAAANMVQCVDAHRGWTMYFKAASEFMENTLGGMSVEDARRRCVVFFPPEIMGIPQIDPASSIMSPMGTRTGCALNSALSDSLSSAYCKLVALSPLRMPEAENQAYTTDSEAAVFAAAGDVWVSTQSQGREGLTMLSTFMFKSINGVRCQLRRRKGTLRLAGEFGPYLTSSRPKIQSAGDTTSLGTLLTTMLVNLKGPISVGDADASPLLQMSDLMHSSKRRCLEVERGSPIGKATGAGWKTPKELYMSLSEGKTALKVLGNFESMLEALDAAPAAAPVWAEALYSCLLEEAIFSRDYSANVISAVVRKDLSSNIYSEHEKEGRKQRKDMYRVLNMSQNSRGELDRTVILGGCLSECLSPAHYADLPQDMKRVMVGFPPHGQLGVLDAITAANAMMNRIMSSFSSGFYLIGNTSNTALDEEMAREEWIRNSYMRGTEASLPYLPKRQVHLAGGVSMSLGTDVGESLSDSLQATVQASLSCCLGGDMTLDMPLIGSSRTEVGMPRDYGVERSQDRPTIRKVAVLMGTRQHALLAGASLAHVYLSLDSWERVLLSGTRIGWTGTSSSRMSLKGPMHSTVNTVSAGKSFFVSTVVNTDRGEAVMKTRYWHTIIQLDRRMQMSTPLAEIRAIPERQQRVLESCQTGSMFFLGQDDVFMRITLDASQPMVCGMYGTSIFVAKAPTFLKPVLVGGFAFSSIEVSPSLLTSVLSESPGPNLASEGPDSFALEASRDVYGAAALLRRGDLPMDPNKAYATGLEIGKHLRESASTEEVMRLMSVVVNCISRGGAPGGQLKRAVASREELGDPRENAEELSEEPEEAPDPQQVHATKMADIKGMLHKGDWADDEVESRSDAGSFGRINVADVIEAHDQEVSANDLTMASRLTRMSLKDARSVGLEMALQMPFDGNPTLFLAAGMCLTLSRDLVATHVTVLGPGGEPSFSHSGWEDMGPTGVLFSRMDREDEFGLRPGILSKESYSMTLEMARIGIRPSGELANMLATAEHPTTMEEALSGILGREEAANMPSFEDVLARLGMKGVQLREEAETMAKGGYESE
jgi:hypothetical protein